MRKYIKLFITSLTLLSLVGCGLGKETATSTDNETVTSTDNGTGFEINLQGDSASQSVGTDSLGVESAMVAEEEGMSYDMSPSENSIASRNMNKTLNPVKDFNTEEYNVIKENGFNDVTTNPLSTFAADVDTGSYCNLRRMVRDGYTLQDIPSGAIRTEELVNYFDYTMLDENKSDGKFSVQYESHPCPWNEEHGLLVINVRANDTKVKSAGNNFVYLIDSSGSMYSEDKMAMAIEGFKHLTRALDKKDIVSIVTYAGDSDVLLEGCSASDYGRISETLDSIEANGGTNGSGGIEAAYDCAIRNLIENGNNRVIIASDGDMNLGVTTQSGLVDLIKEKKESGVFLTTLGFGSGNYSDANMEQIADAGNGNYYYIDCIEEADRVLVDKLMQTTVTVAKDVKFQVEFNPNVISEYRLVGYENRTMSAKDFDDDTKDGGEVGAGQSVTVVYEVTPASENSGKKLKYQESVSTENTDDICTLSIRYKHPKAETSELEDYALTITSADYSKDWNFIAGITEFSLVLRDSDYKENATMSDAINLVNKGKDSDSYRREFLDILTTLSESDIDDDYDIELNSEEDDATLSLFDN